MSKGINLTMARLFQQQLVTNNALGLYLFLERWPLSSQGPGAKDSKSHSSKSMTPWLTVLMILHPNLD